MTVMGAMHGFTFTVWLNERGDGHLSPAPSATKSGPMKFLKLIGQRKSSSHMTRTRRLALDHQCHPPLPQDWVGDAHPQPPRRKRLVEDVPGTDITIIMISSFMTAIPTYICYVDVFALVIKNTIMTIQLHYNTVRIIILLYVLSIMTVICRNPLVYIHLSQSLSSVYTLSPLD